MIDIRQGNCIDLIKDTPDHSVDLIFTDPPYKGEYIHLYAWLANEANRVLKPDGFIAMYVGIYYLAPVIKLVGDKLDYFMELVLFGAGYGSMLWERRVIGRHKSIMLYRPVGGTGMPRTNIVSLFNGTGADKRYHVWGQDEASARYYIDCLSKPGDCVLDPFTGGGTTAAMCKILDRNCVSFEIDPHTCEVARKRVARQQMPVHESLIQNPSLFIE